MITLKDKMSLLEVANAGASRSAHLGNLGARDLLILLLAESELFDLNSISDSAYTPSSLTFAGKKHQLLDGDLPEDSKQFVHRVRKNISVGHPEADLVVEEAIDNSVSLSGFWNVLNAKVFEKHMQTFSQKLLQNKEVTRSVLQILTDSLLETENRKNFGKVRGRYITPEGRVAHFQKEDNGNAIYLDDEGNVYSVPMQNVVAEFLRMNEAIVNVSTPISEGGDIEARKETYGPVFSNEVNALLSFIIDKKNGKEGYHIGGQAMCMYASQNNFSGPFKGLLKLLQDSGYLDDIEDLEMKVFPGYEYRLLSFQEQTSDDLLVLLEAKSGLQIEFEKLNTLRAKYFSIIKRRISDEEKNTMLLEKYGVSLSEAQREVDCQNEIMTSMKLSIDEMLRKLLFKFQQEGMSASLLKEGALVQVPTSQLDFYAHALAGFNWRNSRTPFANMPADKIYGLINKPFISELTEYENIGRKMSEQMSELGKRLNKAVEDANGDHEVSHSSMWKSGFELLQEIFPALSKREGLPNVMKIDYVVNEDHIDSRVVTYCETISRYVERELDANEKEYIRWIIYVLVFPHTKNISDAISEGKSDPEYIERVREIDALQKEDDKEDVNEQVNTKKSNLVKYLATIVYKQVDVDVPEFFKRKIIFRAIQLSMENEK